MFFSLHHLLSREEYPLTLEEFPFLPVIAFQVDQMRKGKADVLETNHTLILGWSDKLYALIRELANANESIGGSAIVIMAEKDKEEMENAIESQEIDLRGSRIICRTGLLLEVPQTPHRHINSFNHHSMLVQIQVSNDLPP